ncbi:MAG TPA: LamG-like jellyroll fold domain-containing protein, partial [Bacteroidia bacterium]
ALVNDGTNWIVYVNGVSVYSAPDSPNSPANLTTIGGQSSGESFKGSIDEVRIWNTGRSQIQIMNFMNCSINGAQTNLVASYNFDDGTPYAGNAGFTTLTDGSGNGNNATLNNFALSGSTSNYVNNVSGLNTNASITISTPATNILAGTSVVFTATSGNGGGTPTYQWYKNNNAVGTNSNTYSDNTLATNDTIKCSIISSSPCASVTTAVSNKIGVTVATSHPAALDFDGTDDYVTIPASTGINNQFAANKITVEGWFYPTSNTGGYPSLIGEAYLGDGNVEFSLYQNGTTVYGGFFDGAWEESAANITLNTWQHIACTYDQANINLYINGVLVSSTPNTNPLPLGTEEWRVGRRWDNMETYKGKMDEIRVWNAARTQAQIKDYMNCTLNGTEANLVAYYNFNAGVPNTTNAGDTILYDYSSYGHSGTLNNFALNGTTSNWVNNVNTMNPAASLSIAATATTIVAGTNVVFTATATNGGGTPTYQWYKNNIAVGINSNTYADNALANNDTISCSVTSSIPCASVNSANSNKLGISVVANLAASLNFDGVNDSVTVYPAPTLDNLASTAITIEAWVYNTNGGVSSIVRKTGDYNLYLNGNVLNAEIWPNGIGDPTWESITGSTVIPQNTWTHVALTWNKGTGTAALYVNGIAESITTNTGSVSGAERFYIGASSIYSQFFQGSLDELRVWNIDRTPAQIANNFNCSLGPQTHLVADYNFNEGTPNVDNTGVTTLTDGSGNGYNGTLSNFTLNGTSSNWVNDANKTNLPPSITITANANSIPGSGFTVAYTATPFNGGIPTYQWIKNGANIQGATASTYTGSVISNDTISCSMVSSSACASNSPVMSNKINLPSWGNTALNFDGNDDNVSIATGNNIPVGNSAYTLEAWIKPNNMGTEGIIG